MKEPKFKVGQHVFLVSPLTNLSAMRDLNVSCDVIKEVHTSAIEDEQRFWYIIDNGFRYTYLASPSYFVPEEIIYASHEEAQGRLIAHINSIFTKYIEVIREAL